VDDDHLVAAAEQRARADGLIIWMSGDDPHAHMGNAMHAAYSGPAARRAGS
jgi:hypothetical protein